MGSRAEVFIFYVMISVVTELLAMQDPTPGEKLAVLSHFIYGALLAVIIPPDIEPQFQTLLLVALFIANFGRLSGRWLSIAIDVVRMAIDDWRYKHGSNTRTRQA